MQTPSGPSSRHSPPGLPGGAGLAGGGAADGTGDGVADGGDEAGDDGPAEPDGSTPPGLTRCRWAAAWAWPPAPTAPRQFRGRSQRQFRRAHEAAPDRRPPGTGAVPGTGSRGRSRGPTAG